MDSERVKAWLKKKKAEGFMGGLFLGVLSLVGGLVVLFLTFWFTYVIVYLTIDGLSALTDIAFNQKLRLGHQGRLICSGIFILVLFLQYLRTDSQYWGEYPTDENEINPVIAANLGHHAPFAVILSRPRTSAKMIADLLLTGPRLTVSSVRTVAKAFRLKRLDEENCARLIAFLSSRGDAVPYEELTAAGWDEWLPQLRQIEGLYFLKKGLLLSSDLRQEISEFHQN